MKRRHLLATLGTLPFAGCGGQLVSRTQTTNEVEAADSGAPYFEQVELSGPSTVIAREEFTLTVTVANTGGRTGDFTATLTVGEGIFARNMAIAVNNVASGERVTKEFESMAIPSVGDWTYRITDYNATHEVSTTPIRADIGTSVEVTDGVRFTVDTIEYKQSVVVVPPADSSVGRYRVYSDAGRVYCLVTATVENTSGETHSVPILRVEDGQHLSELGFQSLSVSHVQGIPSALAETNIAPGERKRGILLYTVPTIVAKQPYQFKWNTGSGPPEILWEIPPNPEARGVPRFSLSSISIPDSVATGQSAPVSATISNTGTGTGTFAGTFEYSGTKDSQYYQIQQVTETISPGESVDVEAPFWATLPEEYAVRLSPFDETATVSFSDPVRAFGESYTTFRGLKMVVRVNNTLADSYKYYNGRVERAESKAFNSFVFAHATVKNTSESSLRVPSVQDFSASNGNTTLSPYIPWNVSNRYQFRTAVDGLAWYQPSKIKPGETYSGWLVFQVRGEAPQNLEYQCEVPVEGEATATVVWTNDRVA